MKVTRRTWWGGAGRLAAAAALAVCAGGARIAHAHPAIPLRDAPGGCQLAGTGGAIKHVIYIQFDNTHFTRDNPSVPSDLEQMPHLLDFITRNGTLLSNHHTPLIAHTGTDILTSLTGVYGDRHGMPVSNSFRYYKPDGTTTSAPTFVYWTDPVSTSGDTTYSMLSADGKNAPAPWVPYTRAGCNVGAVAAANTVLENTGLDLTTVFGAGSPQASEPAAEATAHYVGIAVHCAKGNELCSNANGGRPDLLPDEPGGYNGYNALFGHAYVAPQISPGGPLTDLDGNPISNTQAITYGFPGFDGMTATVSLAYVAAMQEHGIPVTYAYISDAHDNHAPGGMAFGPGEAGYEAQLKAYDNAFAAFFARLAKDGIDKSNTLFVFTADENDHFVGGAPTPVNCDGITIPCTYNHTGNTVNIGELNANLTSLMATQGITTPFNVHADSAPTIYLDGKPARNAAVTRAFERAAGRLTVVNPLTGKWQHITDYMADPIEMRLLHMVTADPNRTPTFTLFANPDYYLYATYPSAGPCDPSGTGQNGYPACVVEKPAFAWNHGDVSPDINRTWLGMVGPGVRSLGVVPYVWSDHTDIRPTMLALLGLQDDYRHDGRVLFEVLDPHVLPPALRAHRATLLELAWLYKQLDAPVGALGLASLHISTVALESNTPDDRAYTTLENALIAVTARRNVLAERMSRLLEGAAFDHRPVNEGEARALINGGETLLARVALLAENV